LQKGVAAKPPRLSLSKPPSRRRFDKLRVTTVRLLGAAGKMV
jgi:hypothetical protein